ncbi:nitrogen regulatory protein P-II family [Thalassoporum mexicanum PCC 7367]|uniref:P-II family nitrogen regulator n=1 Tax=Thalassoporum mexicanum TaxID=3457544 RepID=UPI00029FAF2A|nr:P-II family nitrogen regulator [Pseudanabaena sp. PCC 7367]AFY70017.1 nitrogen regulatory protein P-II family [Pseudanabaena sp. PCC 7367]
MKEIKAIIQASKLDDVKTALIDVGIHGMTASDVQGFGHQKGHIKPNPGSDYDRIESTLALMVLGGMFVGPSFTKKYAVQLLPKTQIEVVVEDDQVDEAVKKILAVANTGEIGDGKIFITNVNETIRLRTGERGDEAL